MPFRMYLTADSAPISPTANAGWEDATQVTRGLLGFTKAGTNAALTATETTAATPHEVAVGQWVSPPFEHATTVDIGNFDITVARLESAAGADFGTRIVTRVVSGDGSVIRAEQGVTSATEWDTALTAQTFIVTTPTVVTVQAGDRLVIEYGIRALNSVTTSFTGTIRHGGTAGDLVDNDTSNVTTHSPWVDWYDPEIQTLFDWGTTAWEGTIDGHLAVEAGFGVTPEDAADPGGTGWQWTDITGDVRYQGGIELTHGRGDEASDAQPAQCRITLDNRAGAYSLGPQASNYPNVKRGTPIRVRADVGDGWVTLFQGSADTWNPSWVGGPSGDATVALNASGALRRLSQGQAPVASTLRRVLESRASVVAYWPCEDGQGADVATSAFAGHPPMSYTGNAPAFETSSRFPSAASLVRLDGTRLVGLVPAYTDTNEQQVRFLLQAPSAPAAEAVLLRVYCPGGSAALWDLVLEVDGDITLNIYDDSGSLLDTSSIALGIGSDGILDDLARLSLEMSQSGSDVVWTARVLFLGQLNGELASGTLTTETLGNISYVEINPDAVLDVTVGHVSVQNDVTSQFSEADEFNAMRYELVTDRIERLCEENPTDIAVTGTSEVRLGHQLPATLLALLRECEQADQGILYDGVGPGLAYISRASRESRDVDLTLDASTGQVPTVVPADDDQRTRNACVVSRPAGGSAVAQDTDGPMGTDAIGIYDDSQTVNISDDVLLPDYASWFVHAGTIPGYRYPSLPLALHHDPDLADEWVAVTPGARVDLTNVDDVLAGHPAGTVSLSVEGYTQQITQFTWDVELVCSPYDVWLTGQIAGTSGDTNEHILRGESDGSTLAAGASAGATSLSVATPSGPLWTTTADDCPMVIDVDGTPVTVTAISGGSSPQTFTVTGATVVRDLASGASVSLYQPRVLGL